MGGLAHTIEGQGIATTQISLIREHTVTIKPPRALWVTFPLGRPLGMPNDPEFQKGVLKAALALLDSPEGPVLEDYPHDAATAGADQAVAACPVDFSRRREPLSDAETARRNLAGEINTIQTWYDLALAGNKRTTAGLSGLTLAEIVTLFLDVVAGKSPESTREEASLADLLRLAAEDLKAHYLEAVAAQPGQATDAASLANWFWGETYAAALINEVRKACRRYDSREMKLAADLLLVPRDQLYRFLK